MIFVLSLSAIPSRGNSSRRQVDAAGARRDRDYPRAQQRLLEGLDGADVRLSRPRAHRRTDGRSRKIDVRSGGDPARGDQLAETLPREDHHVGGHAAAKLGRDGFRALSLRGTGQRGDGDSGRALELGRTCR
jgi:hypothetical protein